MREAKLLPVRLCRRLRREAAALGAQLLRVVYGLPTVEITALIGPEVQIEPPILDDICLPPFAGPADHDDVTPLLKIARALQPLTVVELGTAHGNTVANLCRQCPKAKIYTINAPAEEQTGRFVTYQLSRDDIGRVYRAHGYEDRVVQVFQNTLHLNLADPLGDNQIDLAIVDACHDTEYVINDFHKVRPFVRPEGIVLLHDTHPSMAAHLRGSYLACIDLRRQGYDIRHLRGTWWAVWRNA